MLCFIFLVAVISFLLSLKYSGENQKEYPQLKIDTQLPSPQCSMNGGFYNKPFSISLSYSPHKIYYTLDGSEPSLKSDRYQKPIIISNPENNTNYLYNTPTSPRWLPPIGDVFRGTVLRAICVSDDNKKSG